MPKKWFLICLAILYCCNAVDGRNIDPQIMVPPTTEEPCTESEPPNSDPQIFVPPTPSGEPQIYVPPTPSGEPQIYVPPTTEPVATEPPKPAEPVTEPPKPEEPVTEPPKPEEPVTEPPKPEPEPEPEPESICDPPFTEVQGSCYKVIRVDEGTYDYAREDCENLGGLLATIRCKKENDGILALAKADSALEKERQDYITSVGTKTNNQYRIGLYSVVAGNPSSGLWPSLTDGCQETYRNWANDEPNWGDSNCECETTSEFYVDEVNGNEPGKWNNVAPTLYIWGAICEQLVSTTGDGCREEEDY